MMGLIFVFWLMTVVGLVFALKAVVENRPKTTKEIDGIRVIARETPTLDRAYEAAKGYQDPQWFLVYLFAILSITLTRGWNGLKMGIAWCLEPLAKERLEERRRQRAALMAVQEPTKPEKCQAETLLLEEWLTNHPVADMQRLADDMAIDWFNTRVVPILPRELKVEPIERDPDITVTGRDCKSCDWNVCDEGTPYVHYHRVSRCIHHGGPSPVPLGPKRPPEWTRKAAGGYIRGGTPEVDDAVAEWHRSFHQNGFVYLGDDMEIRSLETNEPIAFSEPDEWVKPLIRRSHTDREWQNEVEADLRRTLAAWQRHYLKSHKRMPRSW